VPITVVNCGEIVEIPLARCTCNGYTLRMRNSALSIIVRRDLQISFVAIFQAQDNPVIQVLREFALDVAENVLELLSIKRNCGLILKRVEFLGMLGA